MGFLNLNYTQVNEGRKPGHKVKHGIEDTIAPTQNKA